VGEAATEVDTGSITRFNYSPVPLLPYPNVLSFILVWPSSGDAEILPSYYGNLLPMRSCGPGLPGEVIITLLVAESWKYCIQEPLWYFKWCSSHHSLFCQWNKF